MVEFNLLPWREYQQAYQIKQTGWWLLTMTGGCLLLLFLAHYWLHQQIIKLQMDIADLQLQFVQQGRKQVSVNQDQDEFIAHLREQQAALMNMVTSPLQIKNTAFCLSDLTSANGKLSLRGRTATLSLITDLLKKYSALPWAQNVSLNHIQHHTNDDNYSFDLLVNQKNYFGRETNDIAKNTNNE